MMAISGGVSWTKLQPEKASESVDYRAFSAVNSPGYLEKKNNDWVETLLFKVDLENSTTQAQKISDSEATGQIDQVIWLTKGETLDIVVTSFAEGFYNVEASRFDTNWYNVQISLDLEIEPFTANKGWLTIRNDGASGTSMNFKDSGTFTEGEINLIDFLPSEVRIDEWIENFCNAFNLRLSFVSQNHFSLDIRNKISFGNSSLLIDLDKRANVHMRNNEYLALPYMYDLGFTLDTDEEGYYNTMEDELDEFGNPTGDKILNSGEGGGGEFYTKSHEINKVTQTSNFSYTWYQQLEDNLNNTIINVPIITDHEVWVNEQWDYDEMIDKRYYDKAQRFWFKGGNLNYNVSGVNVPLNIVTNEYRRGNFVHILDYENKVGSIMRNFFFLLTNESSYTVVEAALKPEEYAMLNKALVKFNGDLYNVGRIDGYDPRGGRKGTIKLIRRLV